MNKKIYNSPAMKVVTLGGECLLTESGPKVYSDKAQTADKSAGMDVKSNNFSGNEGSVVWDDWGE